MTTRTWIGMVALVAGLWPPTAVGGDGRIEINQQSVEAATGFPFTISEPGSYVLTSDLGIPAETDALVLAADGVTLDLNGFAIRGSSTCVAGLCPIGEGDGISRPGGATAPGHRVKVHGGTVSGFPGTCLSVGSDSLVTDLLVQDCGFRGINVGERSLVSGNRVLSTGLEGIALGAGSAFSNNVVALAGLGGGSNAAILGGTATAGNLCDDGSCQPDPRRRFYLTQAGFAGDHGANVCAAGFHMASLWELVDPSNLKYETSLGRRQSDSGEGPTSEGGWIRSGEVASQPASTLNCPAGNTPWASTFGSGAGVRLASPLSWSSPGTVVSPWISLSRSCVGPTPAWCIEN